ncbi:hypothetical protein CW362_04070 [Streptomyces populi]|uniref:DUF6542 domain-containing protein n=1 Tax=Streptomyces populi TaxID=2058924 RepID=A0A2I0SW32_9ACTN|nr:DUF6542 domain-containing protein [Streptomyces populi]PKT74147.1 hypothetical protein CW362_04070 [Streptomyces populi]
MEQHRTRPPQHGPRRGAPVPAQAGRAAGGGVRRDGPVVRRPAPAGVREARPASRPRLTGLGCGLFCGASMFVLACVDQLLFGGSATVYGVLFLPVCVLTALWVRPGDLVTAPVVVPIAFAVGLPPITDDGGGGAGGLLMGLVTALALQAGWLYGGTLAAVLVVAFRRIRLVNRRRADRRRDRARVLPPGRQPR